MTPPLRFSICIPNYNYARYIGTTIRSVLEQSYPHFEIIVADNASTDDSVMVVETFGDPRIRLIKNPVNLGFAPNLDRATETATGDYLLLLSSDDVMKPEALAAYARLIEIYDPQKEGLVLSAGIELIDAQGNRTGEKAGLGAELRRSLKKTGARALHDDDELEIYRGHDLLRAAFQGSMTNIGQFLSTCYSRNLYEKAGGYRSTMAMIPDAQFSQKLMQFNPVVIFPKTSLFQYRLHGANFYTQIFSHIQLYCDKYQLVQRLNGAELQVLGLTKSEVANNFIRHWCLKKSFWNAVKGNNSIAFRAWAFGWSANPACMARSLLAWAMPLVFLLSPITGFFFSKRLKT
ncbi:MAG: glycosyltransferase [Saprospiraceae bacterium]|nr:glycosyltransferase [Saprospiraceae bacterium]